MVVVVDAGIFPISADLRHKNYGHSSGCIKGRIELRLHCGGEVGDGRLARAFFLGGTIGHNSTYYNIIQHNTTYHHIT